MTLLERFKRHVMFLDDSDDSCWIWVGCTRYDGRGKIKVAKNKHRSAHRVAWEFLNGKTLPKGVKLRQECAHPQCVRHWRKATEIRRRKDERTRRGSLRMAHNEAGRACA